MDKEAFLTEIAAIGGIEDDVERRSRLTALSDNVSEVFDSRSNLESQVATLTADNQRIRETNMELFLRVEKDKADPTDPTEPPKEEKLSYDDLFNEKGVLK